MKVELLLEDGARVKPGSKVAKVSGSIASILKAERVVLNFLQRLSGIASETNRYVEAVKGLPVGEYLVRVHSSRGGDSASLDAPPGPTAKPAAAELIPAGYNRNSDHVVRVTAEGPNEFSFHIRSK